MNLDQSQAYPSPIAQEQTFIQRVYQWMALGLALTGAVAMWASRSPTVINTLWSGGFWPLALIEVGIVWWLSASVMSISPNAAATGFLVYSGLNGVTLSYIFLVFTRASIASTFFVAAGTFAACSFYGWTTKKDLTSMGGFLMMALIGFIIASVVNIFFQSPAFYWLLSYVGILIFLGLTAYDIQRLKGIQTSGSGSIGQLAILGALTLYLDFINIFLLMLRAFGRRR